MSLFGRLRAIFGIDAHEDVLPPINKDAGPPHKTPCLCGGPIHWIWHGGYTDIWDHVFPQYWRCQKCGCAFEEPHAKESLVAIDAVPRPWPDGHRCFGLPHQAPSET